MLKAEYRKIFRQGMIYFVLIGVLIFVLFGTINYTENSTLDTYKHYGYQVSQYKTIDDVKILLNDSKQELDSSENLDRETINRLKTSINIYTYLLNDKFIEYENLVDYLGLNVELYANKFSFFRYFTGLMRIGLPILFGIMASLMVTSDFQNGMQKSLYSRNCSRVKIIMVKYIAWAGLALAAVFITYLFGSLYGLSFDKHTNVDSILLANITTAFSANYIEIILLEIVDMLVRIFAYGSIAFGLSLYCKNILVALIPNAVMYGIVYASYFIEYPFVNNIVQGINSVFEYNGSATINILYILLIYGACVGLSMLSIIYLKKMDIK